MFGLAEIGITDRLSLTGEIRYMEETKSLVQFGGNGLQLFPAAPSTVRAENTEDYLTPRITLDYQATDNLLLYAVYAEGVKPGGFNGAAGVSVGLSTYAPEEADSFEAGFKWASTDGKLVVNTSGYYLDASNVQLTTAVPSVSAVNSIATNQGQGEIWGAELELFYSPTENWDFTANYAFSDPKFTRGCDQDQWILTSGGGNFFDGDFRRGRREKLAILKRNAGLFHSIVDASCLPCIDDAVGVSGREHGFQHSQSKLRIIGGVRRKSGG